MPSKRVGAALLAVLFGIGGGWFYVHAGYGGVSQSAAVYQTQAERDDVYVRFEMEAYDAIQKNFWMQPGQYDLAKLFLLSAQKVSGASTTLATSTREATAAMLESTFASATSTDEKRAWAVSLLQVLLYNLPPTNRDQLLSKQQETALRQEVANVNPQKDLYGDLGLSKGASSGEVDTAYKQKSAELAASSSPQAQQELKQVAYAHDVLSKSASKTLYDQAQVEPTVFGHVIGHTLYLDLSQISPTTLGEFGRAIDAASTTSGLTSLIVDLRGNIGGDLSFAQAFVGLFVGQNQYAYDLFHQGDYNPERTTLAQFSELSRYAHLVVLTDNMTQSTAELTTASLKRYKLATVVGTTTRGWGSVENTYPLTTVIDPNTTYALLLVNSLTLRDDEQPIEQNGVVPNISTTDKNWKGALVQTLPSDLASVVSQMLARDPWKF
jgi:hypothetical protein